MTDEPKSVVVFAGPDSNGHPQFDGTLSIPDTCRTDPPATERQHDAASKFYCCNFEGQLTWSQAHALLSYRNYARSCAEKLLQGCPHNYVQMFARLIAVYIASEPVIASYAIARSDKRFRSGADTERVARTKHFQDISTFCDGVWAEIARHRRGH